MSGFSISEDTVVGSTVYQLRGRDPDGKRVFYYISGDVFTVDKDTGIVKLLKPLDREREPILDVIITIIDDKIGNRPANTVSVQREIKVADVNDNRPEFQGTPYSFIVSESTKLFTTVYENVVVVDKDSGINSQVTIECDTRVTAVACQIFNIQTQQIGESRYKVSISLKGTQLDFETSPNYVMTLIATDKGGLHSTADIQIKVDDVQDEPPKFLNYPYSLTVNESTPPGTDVLTVIVRDGDASPTIRRPLQVDLTNDVKKYFRLRKGNDDTWILQTTEYMIDREDPEILLNGGIYQVVLRAAEMINPTIVGDISFANVTVVINDINDQQPNFNLKSVNIVIPEDIASGSAIPGLNLVVSDSDIGDNAKFSLEIEDVNPNNPASKAFAVSPSVAIGRTPVIVKVINSDLLDFEDEVKRVFFFNIVAIQKNVRVASSITLSLSDANDNQPIFEQNEYHLRVPENTHPNQIVYRLQAYDFDSGEFGTITYSLKGFGSEKFSVNRDTGEISVSNCSRVGFALEDENFQCLDYEQQPSYSLTYEATDGGGKYSTVNLFIEIEDINDNRPQFVKNLYVRELYEKDVTISPSLFVKATDNDGPLQGGNSGIRYLIKSTNLTGLTVDPITGEVLLTQAIKADFTLNKITGMRKKLNYEAIVVAKDGGEPPLTSEAKIIIHVKSERDGAPLFTNEPYIANINENSPPGTLVIQVKAIDPDGPDSELKYSIIEGTKDNFILEEHTGKIIVSPHANLDRDGYGSQYILTVAVVDSGLPVPLTSTTNVTIIVDDVNNKPPQFDSDSYAVYLQEEQWTVGEEILVVRATDADSNSRIRYALMQNEIKVRDKTGALLPPPLKSFANAFRIDATTGSIKINSKLDFSKASTILMPIEATDINAIEGERNSQKSVAELSIYLKSHNDKNPVFAPPWTLSNPFYYINLTEEMIIGSTIITFAAKDVLSNKPVVEFEKIKSSDHENYFTISPLSGVMTLNKRIDFEELSVKLLKVSVKAKSGSLTVNSDKRPTSIANLVITVQDINDNSPIFSKDVYEASVSESAVWPKTIITLQATDKDSDEYGRIEYTVSGDGSELFEINKNTGTLSVKKGSTLDRETKSAYNLQVTATDNNRDETNSQSTNLSTTQRKTSVFVKITLTDINDNPPKFSEKKYESIIPENIAIGSKVGSVAATDPDEGVNGQIQYEIQNSEDLFTIDSKSGEIFVAKALSGKGRNEPYFLSIKATDSGTPSLWSETHFSVVIGDISANDGIPKFLKPSQNEIVFVNENAKPGTFVYQVEAIDADSKELPDGQVMYKFANPSPFFEINAFNGIISVSKSSGKEAVLDRERFENHTLILIAYDLGTPSQESHRVLFIQVNDTNDNEPYFDRKITATKVFNIDEEIPIGTVIGSVQAFDADKGVNSEINYFLFDESEKNAFDIETKNNIGYIKTMKRMDIEKIKSYTFAVKAYSVVKSSHEKLSKYMKFNANDFSEMKVQVNLMNINDNPPQFVSDNYITVIKYDIEVNTPLFTFKATDEDFKNDKSTKENWIEYSLKDVTFTRNEEERNNLSHVFDLEKLSGILKSELSLRSYVGGCFNLVVEAYSNSQKLKKHSFNDYVTVNAKIFVLRDKDLLKFIFHKKPDEVKQTLNGLKSDVESMTKQSDFNIHFEDTQFYERKDGSLDFESTIACFQIVKSSENTAGYVLSNDEAFKLLKNSSTEEMNELFAKYGVQSIEDCITNKANYRITTTETWIIILALVMATITILLTIIASNIKRTLKKKMNLLGVDQTHQRKGITPPGHPYGVPVTRSPSFLNTVDQRIYEWQETTNPQLDALSFRSFPTLR
ncbi:cadherin-23-like protein [Leptotrombidium deliense]|uniref:Cadherin-23-like protein n=1 Tax=Leptotrombidium deliense TaxID=299467 RepID=A0A443SVF2_9ACAR|nr:cadherin-23-like protein [Leptotrombidium deliense]